MDKPTEKPDMIEVPRQAVETLVTCLQDAWWVQAAGALEQLATALEAPEVAPEPQLRGFGQKP